MTARDERSVDATPVDRGPSPKLLEALRSVTDQEVFYLPNPGNAGDSLIAHATYRLFDQLGLSPTIVGTGWDGDPRGRTYIYAGGGNLVPYYNDAHDFLSRVHHAAASVIILPHTIAGNEPLLSDFGSNVTIFARERRTLDHVRARAPRTTVHLSHDLALSLDVSTLLSSRAVAVGLVRLLASWSIARAGRAKAAREPLRKAVRLLRRAPRPAGGHLFALREDEESSGEFPRPDSSVDVSKVFTLGTRPDSARVASSMMLRFLAAHDEVTTDRLHVAIACSLLRVPVVLRPGSYFKNRAVFDHSLRGDPAVSFDSGMT